MLNKALFNKTPSWSSRLIKFQYTLLLSITRQNRTVLRARERDETMPLGHLATTSGELRQLQLPEGVGVDSNRSLS